MENLPERRRQMRASDADRDRTIEILGRALADGRLTVGEHSERLDTVHQAKTMGELEQITYDLPAMDDDRPYEPPRPNPVASRLIEPTGGARQSENMVAVFGGGSRKGRWRVRRRTNTVCLFGGFDLDMTEAAFEAPVVELRVFAMFGGVDVKAPDGVELRNEATGIFGGFDVKSSSAPDPGAPVIVVKGFALFGGGSIKSVRKAKSDD